jgi:hypothetical protein
MNNPRALLLPVTILALSCGGAQSAATPSAARTKRWSEQSPTERATLMKTAVLPRMRDAFQTNDLGLYANFDCATCHGAGAKDKTFKMPNPALTKLDPSNSFKSNKELNAVRFTFMTETVVPEMARLLGEPVFDPKTGKGIGCLSCHVNKS